MMICIVVCTSLLTICIPNQQVVASLDEITVEGRIELAHYWWGVLSARHQVIVGSKLRMERPKGYSLQAAIAVTRRFAILHVEQPQGRGTHPALIPAG